MSKRLRPHPPKSQRFDSDGKGRPKPRRKRSHPYNPYNPSYTAEPLRLLLLEERRRMRAQLRQRGTELRERLRILPKSLRGSAIEAEIRREMRLLEQVLDGEEG